MTDRLDLVRAYFAGKGLQVGERTAEEVLARLVDDTALPGDAVAEVRGRGLGGLPETVTVVAADVRNGISL